MPTALASRSENGNAFPLLRKTDVRKFLGDGQLRQLETYCRTSNRKPGVTVFRQGEPANFLYLLLEGCVELRARPPGRRVYRTVEVVLPNCTFGDETLFGDEVYLASARVLEGARTVEISRTAFESLTAHHPDVAAGILRASGSCLLNTISRSAILTQSPAEVGLRHLLDELVGGDRKSDGRTGTLHITHAQLAGVLHLSRETVSRMLATMASEGAVELGRGTIRVRRL